MDKLSIYEPTRSKLASLRWVAEPGYLQAWTAWYRSQSTCGVGWVIRQIETGLEAPPGKEKHPPERDALHPGKGIVDGAAGMDVQDKFYARQAEGPGDGRDADIQPWRELWEQVLGELHHQMTQAAFDAWLASSRPVEKRDDQLTIGVRNQYAKEWLDIRFRPLVLRALAGIDPTISQVAFVVWNADGSMGSA